MVMFEYEYDHHYHHRGYIFGCFSIRKYSSVSVLGSDRLEISSG